MTRVEVTQDDIDGGFQKNAGQCPVACALRRAVGSQVRAVSVAPYYALFIMDDVLGDWREGDSSSVQRLLPAEARDFVRDFDADRPVEPFAFDLDVPR